MRYPDLIPKDRPGLSFANLATRINKAHATFQANSDANLLRTLGAQLAKNAARSRLVSSISTTAKVPS